MAKCQDISDIPGLMPGWGCCQCKTYNGFHRPECKFCEHKRCDVDDASELPDDEDNFTMSNDINKLNSQ